MCWLHSNVENLSLGKYVHVLSLNYAKLSLLNVEKYLSKMLIMFENYMPPLSKWLYEIN